MECVAACITGMNTAFNDFFLGLECEDFSSMNSKGPLGSAQSESLHRSYLVADNVVGDNTVAMPGKDWSSILQSKRVGYACEVVAKAVNLTM